MESNVQLQLASDFVQFTDKNIFLTGKAGTGKTTFLHELKKYSVKRMAIVAPTGVAAINAGGVTIHSFFQLPFGPYIPEDAGNPPQKRNTSFNANRFHKEKINLIRSLDLLVIDEISMVRADTLDGIDEVLRRYKDHSKPFGGLQLLMIGDLHQLSPVVKQDDWQILKDYYPNLYFFNSKALKRSLPVSIELKHIYRQSDTAFIDLLNRIRENAIDATVLDKLNERYIPGFNPPDEQGYITLTTHNNLAQEINVKKLLQLKVKVQTFIAEIGQEFPEYSYPTVVDLELKVGAQVMFVKNDNSREKLFYNGKIGKVVRLTDDTIYVKCPDDQLEIAVQKAEWQNIKYTLNPVTKEVVESVIGTFSQFPLKLAWAITIHKSQGLTFERAIIDANAAFAHGQVYVALSRCKSFEGMVLSSAISSSSVKTDGTVAEYTRNASNNEPGEKQLNLSKISFQQSLLFDLFDYKDIKQYFFQFQRIVQENDRIVAPSLADDLIEMREAAEKEIYLVAASFQKQLQSLLQEDQIPEENDTIQERVKKGCAYFVDKTRIIFQEGLRKLSLETDNKAVKKSMSDVFERLKKATFIKGVSLKFCSNGFNTLGYLKTKANADIDYETSLKVIPATRKTPLNTNVHSELYSTLWKWRSDIATDRNVPVYIVLPQKSLIELVEQLPSTSEELEKINGIGKTKVKSFGKDILEMIASYCENKGIDRHPMEIKLKETKVKIDTKEVSLRLFKSGKSIQNIATERGFNVATIETHLTHFIGTGGIGIHELVPKEKANSIAQYIKAHHPASINDVKGALGDAVTYSEIRAVMKHLEYVQIAV
ncbi:DNA repair and recombination protein, putative helicase [Arcticibacter svalbardensis MN12-7]|uniref:DNA repair and recombination protein, putative helicase n=1 Tax=Arcticibacter svalbardensis MN12-7 TaxID=1150600 RepID=R9GNR0_9SPHI|nr:helix-turn-helix domain-containing protein [Arcticibacter svalbardensis]EOR93482.1 DNA repair and recombination protein, putative helicase [Arcticibacter svalbardensis MN12-7]